MMRFEYLLAVWTIAATAWVTYVTCSFVYRRLVARQVRKMQEATKMPKQVSVDLTKFAAGGFIPSQRLATVGQTWSQILTSLPETTESEPLEETWSNEKVEAWRIIDVHVEKGDPDGLWLGFPHPDGPTADVATPLRHPVGVELHAECKPMNTYSLYPCDDVPGESCISGYGSGCGFYAFKTRDQAVAFAQNPFTAQHPAVARVLLSGKVIEHENGYRAEILEVVEVEAPAPSDLSMGIGFAQAVANIQKVGRQLNPPHNPFTNLGGT